MILNVREHRGIILLWFELNLPVEYRAPSYKDWRTCTRRTNGWVEGLRNTKDPDPYPGYRFRLRPSDDPQS